MAATSSTQPPQATGPKSISLPELLPLREQDGSLTAKYTTDPNDPLMTIRQRRMLYAFQSLGRPCLADEIRVIAAELTQMPESQGFDLIEADFVSERDNTLKLLETLPDVGMFTRRSDSYP